MHKKTDQQVFIWLDNMIMHLFNVLSITTFIGLLSNDKLRDVKYLTKGIFSNSLT